MSHADIINLVLTVATVAMAPFTVYMAYETKSLAKEGRESSRLMEKHHQEGLVLILTLKTFPIDSQDKGLYGIRVNSNGGTDHAY